MYHPAQNRYETMLYNRCGQSGLLLPAISLGLWQNFGKDDNFSNMQQIIFKAFDRGITHFDLANNYGPPPGEAEKNFGNILAQSLKPYRDEIIISSKAGYYMWPGPYGEWGSRKYLMASINQSLERMRIDYVDIFYSHRPDPNTPLEETMLALHDIVKSGKALYIGLSNYSGTKSKEAISILEELKTPFIIHQPRYSMLDRWAEKSLLQLLESKGIGCIAYSPLAQGRLTNKYLQGIPPESRVGRGLGNGAISQTDLPEGLLQKIIELNALALNRDQTLAQMAIAWLLKDKRVTSVLIGASKVEQLENSIDALQNLSFSETELQNIENILSSND